MRCLLRVLCSAASHVVREALKWKAKDAEAVDVIHATAPDLIAVYKQLQGQPDGVPGACAGGGPPPPAPAWLLACFSRSAVGKQ